MKELQGKVMSVGEHHRDDEESHGVYVEVSKEQLSDRGVGFLYREARVEIVDPRPAISAAEAEQTLRAKTQPPSACPFCGAIFKDGWNRGNVKWFTCGTMTSPHTNRNYQTAVCADAERNRLEAEREDALARLREATAERERLTRDRDDLATKATALAVQVAELTRELEGHAHDLSPAMVQARNDQLAEENANLHARVDRLERLVDGVHYIDGVHLEELDGLSWFDARTAAKEDKP